MASDTQKQNMMIGRGILFDGTITSATSDDDASSRLFRDISGTESSVVCIHSDRAGDATSFRVYVEDPTQENTGTTAITASSNSFLLYQRAVAANEVTRINVPGGFGSRMFCVFQPDSGTANVKIWAWSASSQARR